MTKNDAYSVTQPRIQNSVLRRQSQCSKFHTNCYRMILATCCRMLRKITWRQQNFCVRKPLRKETQRTEQTFRHDVICVTIAVSKMRKEMLMIRPEYLHVQLALEALFSVRI